MREVYDFCLGVALAMFLSGAVFGTVAYMEVWR